MGRWFLIDKEPREVKDRVIKDYIKDCLRSAVSCLGKVDYSYEIVVK